MFHRLSLLALPIGLSACGFTACGGPTSSVSSSPPLVPSVSSEGAEAGTYAIHEWGLLRGGPGDVLEVGTMGPRLDVEAMVVEKPVLYFHLSGDASLDLGVANVVAVDGVIREHWPLSGPRVGPEDETRISWAPLTLRPERCAFLAPGDRASACGALPADEVCESLSLAPTVTADASCVETASGRSPILFYRSTSRGLTAPLTATQLDLGDMNVRNDSDLVIPGMLVRFIEGPAGLRVVVSAPPAPHQVIVMGHEDRGTGAAQEAIIATMLELGLTTSEANAFLASWEGELFRAEVAAEEIMPEGMGDTSSLLYFLPEALTERVSRLTFEPPPRAIHRALAIWTAVR